MWKGKLLAATKETLHISCWLLADLSAEEGWVALRIENSCGLVAPGLGGFSCSHSSPCCPSILSRDVASQSGSLPWYPERVGAAGDPCTVCVAAGALATSPPSYPPP